MSAFLDITPERVKLGDNFDTNFKYLYLDPNPPVSGETLFTKTLNTNNQLQVYQETDIGQTRPFSNQSSQGTTFRDQTAPQLSKSGPYFEKLCVDGIPDNKNFLNVLLIDKPPIRTGFFQFFIGQFSFNGVIERQTQYDHYNWQQVGTNPVRYDYVQQNSPLSYGIVISNNQLFTSELQTDSSGQSYYKITPKPLKLYLDGLKGGEEITSVSTTLDPNTYNDPVLGLSIPSYYDEAGDPVFSFNFNTNLYGISDADVLRYIASYPDLIEQIGVNIPEGRNHYLNFAEQQNRKILFNPISYLNLYADLKQIYQSDTYNATIHYITTGYDEGRTYIGGSTESILKGGLYDERFGNVPIEPDTIIWPIGKTIDARGKSITYKTKYTTYNLRENIPFNQSFSYMRAR